MHCRKKRDDIFSCKVQEICQQEVHIDFLGEKSGAYTYPGLFPYGTECLDGVASNHIPIHEGISHMNGQFKIYLFP